MATFEKGKVFAPQALVDYAEGSVVSRELEHNEAGSITVFFINRIIWKNTVKCNSDRHSDKRVPPVGIALLKASMKKAAVRQP